MVPGPLLILYQNCLYMLFDLFYKIALGLRANQFVYYFTTFDEDDGGDGSYVKAGRQLRVQVHVYFAHVYLAVVFF